MHLDEGEDGPDRRRPPARRDVVFNEADRVLAVAILDEFESKLGMKLSEVRDRDKTLKELLPTMVSLVEAAKARKAFYDWMLTTAGKAFALTVMSLLVIALLKGFLPAFGIILDRLLKP